MQSSQSKYLPVSNGRTSRNVSKIKELIEQKHILQKKRDNAVTSKKSRYTSEVHKSANIETQKTAPTV